MRFCLFSVLFSIHALVLASPSQHCDYYQAGNKNLYWGDLHVHTAYSLDAYAFGTLNTPAEAYAFAQGQELRMADGSKVKLERPLDFVAVTDHAEWFDLMHICTDPQQLDNPYCNRLREDSSIDKGGLLFRDYVIPTITLAQPAATPICKNDPQRCAAALESQWARVQQQANDANKPCEFTAQIGYEWSYTQSFSHSHRNIIFKNEHVTRDAIDYIRFPTLQDLWQQLDKQCRPEDDCDVIAIPHNTNMGDGMTFDVETASDQTLMLRSRYEKLVEIHQEKGNSECLSPLKSEESGDCGFENYLTYHSSPKQAAQYTDSQWNKMRSTYVRRLLLRGLKAYESSASGLNPLQMGIIASTDNHSATPGHVQESQWQGPAFGLGNIDRSLRRKDFNPGGLVAVWAEENTRESIFAALKRREVYATSGPRIKVKLSVATAGKALSCEETATLGSAERSDVVVMGGDFSTVVVTPHFKIESQFDQLPLDRVEIIKGQYSGGELKESVVELWQRQDQGENVCVLYSDTHFDASAPAFWYVRVKEIPSARWSAVQCRRAQRCDDFPGADITVVERAWTSPIWYLPPKGNPRE